MEENKNINPYWLKEEHPNYSRWKKARDIAFERGDLVYKIISGYCDCNELTILDLGSGAGGTSARFSASNFVVSADLDIMKLNGQILLNKVNCNASLLPFHDESFDLIILQDVIEHIQETSNTAKEIKRVLNKNGLIYLSTPNRNSIFNFIADPHWNLPLISLLKRSTIKKILNVFRKEDSMRNDLAELLSLQEIHNLFDKEYSLYLNTKKVTRLLLEGHRGILWSNFHLLLIKLIRLFRSDKILIRLVSDKENIINRFATPTFYYILIRKAI